jgi:hypothetical protein
VAQINWHEATLHVRRVKNGKPATHPIRGDEMRALRKLQREQQPPRLCLPVSVVGQLHRTQSIVL